MHARHAETFGRSRENAVEWDDLRIFLAIAREGTLVAAARKLGQTQPTMGRRLRALEEAVGHTLFQRSSEGFHLTEEGSAIFAHAERMEEEVLAATRALAGHEAGLEGLLRVASSEWFGRYLLAPILAEFGRVHPRVVVELLTEPRLRDLGRREADLSFRIKPFDEPELVSRRVLHVPYALYGVQGTASPVRGSGVGHRLITMDTAFAAMPDAEWLARVLPKATIAFRSNNREVQAELCARGAGLAVLPRPLGDRTPSIVALDVGEEPPGRDTFAGYHRDLRHQKRLRAFFDLAVARLGGGRSERAD